MRTRAIVCVAVAVVLAGCLGGPIGLPGAEGSPSDEPGESLEAPPDGAGESPPEGDLEVHYIDVGQGDATLAIAANGETMLIDSGDWRDDGETVLSYLDRLGIDRLDHLVTTHGHADHVGGHAAVIEEFETNREGVGAVYDPGVATDTATYERYLDAVERHEVTLFRVASGDAFTFGEDVGVEFYNPPPDPGNDLDDGSLAFALEHGNATLLVTGDAGERAERRMIDDHGDALAATAYQAGHHGSATSSSAAFLHRVDPRVAVISSDYDSQYGHPHEEVLDRFADRAIEIYWTGTHGTIVATSDGEAVTIATQTTATTNASELRSEPESTANVTDPVEERSTVPAAVGPPVAPTTASPIRPPSSLGGVA